MPDRLRRLIGPLLAVILFSAAGYVMFRELKAYHLHDLRKALQSLPRLGLLTAAIATLFNYLVLSFFDVLALRYAEVRLSFPRSALTTFLAYSFGNSIGLSIFGTGTVRYRLYSSWGLSLDDIVKVILFTSLTLWIGIIVSAGLALAIEPPHWSAVFPVYYRHGRIIGFGLLAITLAYILITIFAKKPFRFKKFEMAIPSTGIAVPQILLACLQWLTAGLALYSVLPNPRPVFTAFLTVFLVAQLIGLISHVPGGLGVFDTIMLLFLKAHMPPQAALAGLIAYRCVYYLTPLVIGLLMFAGFEVSQRMHVFKNIGKKIADALTIASPAVLSIILFGTGFMLLLSGTLPATPMRLKTLSFMFPLAITESAHFFGSITGVLLIITAARLQGRFYSAWLFSVILLGVGVVFSMLKGLDYEQAIILAGVLLFFLPFRKRFTFRLSILRQPITPGWLTALILTVLSCIWLGVFTYKRIHYRPDLFLKFDLSLNGPRFFRAAVGITIVVLITSFLTLLRIGLPHPRKGLGFPSGFIFPIVGSSTDVSANLALLGDKQFLFNPGKTAFIMYGWSRATCIAMGDPIGPSDQARELIWLFCEEGAREGANITFYQVSEKYLNFYSDYGFSVFKFGETALVDLGKFSVEKHEIDGKGLEFSVIPGEQSKNIYPEIKEVSDRWIYEKHISEKGFSMGYFKQDYLACFDIAVIRKDNRLLGFANLWKSPDKEEMSVDLLRTLPNSGDQLNEVLLTNILHHAKQEGFHWFDLGLTALPEHENREFAPYWNRLASFVFHRWEESMNFQEIRNFKEKFSPVWSPRYLALSGGASLPRTLLDVAAMISRGPKNKIE